MADNEQDWDAILADGMELQNIATRMVECAKAMGATAKEEEAEEVVEAPEEGQEEEMDASEDFKLPTGKPALGREAIDPSINDVADKEKAAKKAAIVMVLKKKLAPK